MENHNSVPYIVYESSLAREERIVKRLWITTIVLILLLFVSNALWLFYESQWEYVQDIIDQDVDAEDSENIFVNAKGDIVYGDTDSTDNSN